MATSTRTFPRFERLPSRVIWLSIVAGAVLIIASFVAVRMLTVSNDSGVTTLTSADRGKTVALKPEQELIVRLPSNATTGYRWAVETLDVNVVTYLGSTYNAPGDGLIGQGGSEDLRFRAIAPGQTALVLKYWQPWSGESSTADHFELTFGVTAE